MTLVFTLCKDFALGDRLATHSQDHSCSKDKTSCQILANNFPTYNLFLKDIKHMLCSIGTTIADAK